MLRRFWPDPRTSESVGLEAESTLKVSAMQEMATSMDSRSSSRCRVPSVREVVRKSMMARARRFLVSWGVLVVAC